MQLPPEEELIPQRERKPLPGNPHIPLGSVSRDRFGLGRCSMGDPVTEQIGARTDWQRAREDPAELPLAAQRLVEDAVGNRIPFGTLYKEQKTIVIFLRVRETPPSPPPLSPASWGLTSQLQPPS